MAESVNWRKNYIKTFLEQDIPNLGFQVPPPQLRRFWLMLAHYHGQILNASELGRSMAISHHTVKNYIDILVGTFMIRQLEPWFENISKRQIKSPKIYFRDSGILHTLLNIETEDQLHRSPRSGSSWEGFALEETIRLARVANEECFFWSTQSGAELDLFMMRGSKRIGFEFKYADAPGATKSMHIALEDLKLDHLYVIVPGENKYLLHEKITVCGLDGLEALLLHGA
jgi:predicted AAA+ superfamily ATPase